MAPVAFQDCRELNVSVPLLSQCRWLARQGACLSIHPVVSPGGCQHYLGSSLLGQGNTIPSEIISLWNFICWKHTMFLLQDLGGRDWMSLFWSQAVRPAFPLGTAVGDHHPLSPGIYGNVTAGKQVKKGCSSPASCLEERKGLEPDFTLPSGYSSPLIMAFSDLAGFLMRS